MHGVELVRQVIAKVREEGLEVLGRMGVPQGLDPSALAELRLEDGSQLSPALREWLAFDASFLGWFEDGEPPRLPTRSVAEIAAAAYPSPRVKDAFATLTPNTLPAGALVLPGGKHARRILYLGATDSAGEPPVLVLDGSDNPFVCVEYPGIDVYLAVRARLLEAPRQVFAAFFDDEVHGPRMQEHADHLFGGRRSLQYGDEGFSPPPAADVEEDATILLAPGEPVPEGYVVVQEMPNPLTRMSFRLAAPIASTRLRDLSEG